MQLGQPKLHNGKSKLNGRNEELQVRVHAVVFDFSPRPRNEADFILTEFCQFSSAGLWHEALGCNVLKLIENEKRFSAKVWETHQTAALNPPGK